jgi:hypothetical protein
MGARKRQKAVAYEPEPLLIGVQIDGKEVRYGTWLQGPPRFALIDQFRQEYGYQNVRVYTEKERNLISNNHGARVFHKSFTAAA